MQTPERLVNYKVFSGAGVELGTATVDLPSFETLTETISGAGIAGEFESPVLGHFKSQKVKLMFRAITRDGLGLVAPVRHILDIRASVQIADPTSAKIVTEAWRVECAGRTLSHTLGKLEPGKVMGAECDLEIDTIRISRDGVDLIELDKFNSIYKVNGVDYLAQVRRDLGGV